MRIRLFIDVTLDGEEVAALAELIAEQPPATVTITKGDEKFWGMGGRFMGASPVHQDEAGAH